MTLEGNTILITGGSSGLGLEMANEFVELDNTVIICGRSREKLDAALQISPKLIPFQCDLSKVDDCDRMTAWISENYPDLNVLINNAALSHVMDFDQDSEALDKMDLEIDTNLRAPLRLIKNLLPLIEKNPNPKVVNITTGLIYAPKVHYPIYNATKAGLHAFTQVLRMQLAKSPVKVIEILYPAVDTPWHKNGAPDIAISAKQAVAEAMKGLKAGKEEIAVGKVGILKTLSRISPSTALKIVNKV